MLKLSKKTVLLHKKKPVQEDDSFHEIHVPDKSDGKPANPVKVIEVAKPIPDPFNINKKIQTNGVMKHLTKKDVALDPAAIGDGSKVLDFSVPKIVLLLGKPNRGKTYALRHLLLQETLKDDGFTVGIVFTNSTFNHDYDWFDQSLLVTGWNESVFVSWLAHMKAHRKTKETPPIKNFIVFDDMVQQIPFGTALWNNFVCNHRHYGTSVFISCQYLNKGTSPTLRECINYAIMFNTKSIRTIEILYEIFGQLFESKNAFKEYFFALTHAEYTAMLYDQDDDMLASNYVSYKAPADVPEIRLKFNYC